MAIARASILHAQIIDHHKIFDLCVNLYHRSRKTRAVHREEHFHTAWRNKFTSFPAHLVWVRQGKKKKNHTPNKRNTSNPFGKTREGPGQAGHTKSAQRDARESKGQIIKVGTRYVCKHTYCNDRPLIHGSLLHCPGPPPSTSAILHVRTSRHSHPDCSLQRLTASAFHHLFLHPARESRRKKHPTRGIFQQLSPIFPARIDPAEEGKRRGGNRPPKDNGNRDTVAAITAKSGHHDTEDLRSTTSIRIRLSS